jgi:hypothetical protein
VCPSGGKKVEVNSLKGNRERFGHPDTGRYLPKAIDTIDEKPIWLRTTRGMLFYNQLTGVKNLEKNTKVYEDATKDENKQLFQICESQLH